MNSLKFILAGMICISLLTACGCSANENHKNTTSTEKPTEHVTEHPDKNNTADGAVSDIIDDTGNVIEDTGNAVNDASHNVGEALQ